MDVRGFRVGFGYRWSPELRGWVPTLSVENLGPAAAQDVTVAVASSSDPGRGAIGERLFDVGVLAPGEVDTVDLLWRATGDTSPFHAEVRWRDAAGSHEQPEIVRPVVPARLGAATTWWLSR